MSRMVGATLRGRTSCAAAVAFLAACGSQVGTDAEPHAIGDSGVADADDRAAAEDVVVMPIGDAGEEPLADGDVDAEACAMLPALDADAPCVYLPDSGGFPEACCPASFNAPQQFCITDGCHLYVRVESTPPECICGGNYDCQCLANHFGIGCVPAVSASCVGGGTQGIIIVCGDPAC